LVNGFNVTCDLKLYYYDLSLTGNANLTPDISRQINRLTLPRKVKGEEYKGNKKATIRIKHPKQIRAQ
jgi:hypothetical protein